MERVKVGIIVGEAKANISKIKKILDSTKQEIDEKTTVEKAVKKFEKIMKKEMPEFDMETFSSDALCEPLLLTLFEVDEVGNLYLEKDKTFKIETVALLREMLGCFGLEVLRAAD